jgi:energy-coupling factor transporter ATP-binding protein EcfA2
MHLLRELAHGEGHAVLLSTHDLELALRHAETVWLCAPGEADACRTTRRACVERSSGADLCGRGVVLRYGTRIVHDATHPARRRECARNGALRDLDGACARTASIRSGQITRERVARSRRTCLRYPSLMDPSSGLDDTPGRHSD